MRATLVRCTMLSARRRGSAGSDDPAVSSWMARVGGNGGTVGSSTKSAVATLVTALKTAGVWPKIQRMNLFAGTGLAACAVPLINTAGGTLDTLTNFVESDYSESTGLTGDGSTKYLNTGMLASALTANSTHWSVYYKRATAGNQQLHIGATESTNAFHGSAAASNGTILSDQYDASTSRLTNAVSAPYGFACGSRVASNDHKIYKGATQVATSSTGVTGALPARNIFVFARNAGFPFEYSAGPLAMYSVGAGLTPTEVADFATAIQAFQSALGRSV